MQRVSLVPGGTYRVRLKIGAESHGGLKVRLCEQHLLYPFHCLSCLLAMCRIPDDCIDEKRYPLFMARAVIKELIELLQSTGSEKSC